MLIFACVKENVPKLLKIAKGGWRGHKARPTRVHPDVPDCRRRVFAEQAIPDGFWQSILQIREGVSDFGGRSVGALFKNVQFHDLDTANGGSTFTFRRQRALTDPR